MNSYQTRKSYYRAIAWFLLSLVISSINDAVMKKLASIGTGMALPIYEVIFFRLFFGTLLISTLLLWKGNMQVIKDAEYKHIYAIQGIGFLTGCLLWVYGLTQQKLTTTTMVSFSGPFWGLILSVIFLKEAFSWRLFFCMSICFIGVIVGICPSSGSKWQPNIGMAALLFAAIIFASLDVILKAYVRRSSSLAMLFYTSLVGACSSFPLVCYYGRWVTLEEVAGLAFLGLSGNLLLYVLYRAYRNVALLSSLIPFRFVEMIIAGILGHWLLGNAFSKNIWQELVGGILILVGVALATRVQYRPVGEKDRQLH